MKAKNPEEWGYDFWYVLHGLPWHCPGFQGKVAADFIVATPAVLPCDTCDKNFHQWIGDHPVRAGNREELGRWLVTAHNDVNRRIHKRDIEWSIHVQELQYEFSDAQWVKSLLATLEAVFSQYEYSHQQAYIHWLGLLIQILSCCGEGRLADNLYRAFFHAGPCGRWCDGWANSKTLLALLRRFKYA